ncbi:hypothetical protein EDB84DRAFT_1441991 [Lactarius hengduanensis]|nr:hypothetical protein EDB84DRAFT_1441991 [Lactarius hengduanensis]
MSLASGPMTDLLHSQLGDARFSEAGLSGYQTREAPRSADQYMLGRDPHTQSYHHPHPPSLWSPFPGSKDTNTPHTEASYDQESVNAMRSQDKKRVLSQATHEDLFGAQNPVYVHLYTENLKLTASHETLEYVLRYSSSS